MAIINMVAQGSGGGGGGNIGEPLNLTVTASGLDVTITWKDNVIGTIPPTTFQKSELVRKIGSAPTSPSDGTLVVTETVMDTYETTGYVDQGLTDGETYYYRVFSYSDLGGISYCDAESVTIAGGWTPDASRTLFYYEYEQNLNDDSGNNRTATGNNIGYTQTLGGQYAVTNNTTSNSYVNPPAINGSGISDFAVSFWIYTIAPGTGRQPQIFAQSETSAPYKGPNVFFGPDIYWSTWTTNSFMFRLSNTNQQYTNAITLNTWHHVVFTRISGTCKAYVDATEVLSWSDNTTWSNVGQSYIFNSNNDNSAQGWGNTGAMGDKYIYENVGWTAQKVSDYYSQTKGDYVRQPGANTVAYYPLTADFNDASGNGYNLTVSNASITTLGGVDCAYYNTGRAYNSSVPVGTVRTLSAWVYNIYQSDDRAIIGTGSSANNFYAMFLAVSNGKAQISDFHQIGISGATLTQNVWHNIVAVNDNTSMKIYVDGVLSNSGTHSYTSASTGISVGGKPFSDAYDNLNNCIGYVSEAIIENVAWTDQEVADYFNSTKGDYGIS